MTSANEQKMNSPLNPPLNPPKLRLLLWIKITTVLTSLIAMTFFFLLFSKSSSAQPPGFDQGQGFAPPAQNPNVAPGNGFTPPSAAPNPDFFDDEDDFFDDAIGKGAGGGGGNSATGGGGGGSNAPSDPSGGKRGRRGIEVGGGSPGGVTIRNGEKAIRIDTETGTGSKEMITDFNYPDADIVDIAKTLGKLTGKNFILDKDVKGRMTVISNSPITVGDAWRAFLTGLDMNGFTLIPSGRYLRIARQRDARDKQISTYTGSHSPDTDTLVTRVFALKYIGAEEIARVFRSFSPANARIIAHEQTNTVIVTDTGANISKLSKMLNFLDVEGFDAGIEVVPVRYASAIELSKLIDTLIPGTGATTAQKAGGGAGFGRPNFTARRTKEGGIINTIIADERSNSLIIHANQKGADQVRDLVARLDKKNPSPIGGGKIHVVYLQFADSEALATTLNSFSQQNNKTATPTGSATGTGLGINPQESALFEGQIKVSADKATNSLVITASPADFVTVQRVINRLDIPRDEVFAEIVIMEMSLSKTSDLSANVLAPIPGGGGNGAVGFVPNADLTKFLADPTSQKGMVLGFQAGAQQQLRIGANTVTVGSVNGLIRALQTNANGNLIATPQILTLDNTEATFESAENIPQQSATAVQGAVSSSITYNKIPLSITIKPQINKISNFVKMDIQTKISDISPRELPAQVSTQAFATLERSAKTSVVVADSDTVVLGGLIRDKQTETVSKIPLLGDIPLLGWLFKSRSTTKDKINLIVFITPHIIRQYEKIRAILDRKLKQRDDFIEKNAGGDDPMRSYRDDMIRSLPDIKEVISSKPRRNVSLNGEEEAGMGQVTSPTQNEPKAPSLSPAIPAPETPAAPTVPSDGGL